MTLKADLSRDLDLSMGSQVRNARKRLNRSLQDVANATGLSVSMISKIERGLSAPSIRSLMALAETLDLQLGKLFPPEENNLNEKQIVVRKAARPRLDFGEKRLVKELLTPQPLGELELLMITLAPGGSTGEGSFSHKGEEGGVVISGRLELTIGDQVVILEQGDSFRFTSVTPHSYRSVSDVDTIVLWANTPPFY